jgi:ABC-2 type transport system ATP-binding protein
MILGLLYPTSGTISIFGTSPANVKIKKRIGYLPEETYLYKYLTALETLDFFGSLFSIPSFERKKRCHQLLEMVGLTHAAHRPVGEFSKGMARRIGIAQAMINDPELLILDEPTSGLDPIGCREIKDLIALLESRGKTVIICSHLLSDVESICDRVIIMYGGKIRAVGALSELLTVADINTFSAPVLSMEKTAEVLAILRKYLNSQDVKVDHPKKSLEDFFLEVIEKAKEDQVETFGASSGGKIAEYLKINEETPVSSELLNELSNPLQIKTSSESEQELVDPEQIEIDESLAEESLNNLIETDIEDRQNDEKSELRENDDDESLQEVNEKLKDLMK